MTFDARLLFALPCLAALACAGVACVPKRDLPPEQIVKLEKLDEVMDVQATVADPQFKKIGEASYTDQDWAAFADLSTRIDSTSKKIPQFTKGPEFDAFAAKLGEHAAALGAAATAKNVAGASDALAAMKATCKACHAKFK